MSSCSCDYGPPSVFNSTNPVARREHRCDECGSPICVGERYERVFGVWDGDASTIKTCERCLAVRDFVKAAVPCFCWGYGQLLHDAMECAREWAHEDDELVPGTRRLIAAAKEHRRPANTQVQA